jgi:putative PIN family toxin of toxin-antitoxin system
MSSKRYVFDTNTLVSALLFEHSTPGQAFLKALQLGEILLSQATLEELADVLQREKFDRYVTTAQREEFLEALVERATFIETTEKVQVCRDTRDDKFLGLAISGNAAYIVSGDNDRSILSVMWR